MKWIAQYYNIDGSDEKKQHEEKRYYDDLSRMHKYFFSSPGSKKKKKKMTWGWFNEECHTVSEPPKRWFQNTWISAAFILMSPSSTEQWTHP